MVVHFLDLHESFFFFFSLGKRLCDYFSLISVFVSTLKMRLLLNKGKNKKKQKSIPNIKILTQDLQQKVITYIQGVSSLVYYLD